MEMREVMNKEISGGVYLVVDPGIALNILLKRLESALAGGIDVIQLWNNWPKGADKLSIIKEIAMVCRPYSVPMLINEEWDLLLKTKDLHGVHFDRLPDDLQSIRLAIGRPFITGVTCTGDLDVVRLAAEWRVDYISFCAMFPSSSAGSCTLVLPEIVQQASRVTDLPIFISGGMTPENTFSLKQRIPFNGVAVISGIMGAENPELMAKAYQLALTTKSELK